MMYYSFKKTNKQISEYKESEIRKLKQQITVIDWLIKETEQFDGKVFNKKIKEYNGVRYTWRMWTSEWTPSVHWTVYDNADKMCVLEINIMKGIICCPKENSNLSYFNYKTCAEELRKRKEGYKHQINNYQLVNDEYIENVKKNTKEVYEKIDELEEMINIFNNPADLFGLNAVIRIDIKG